MGAALDHIHIFLRNYLISSSKLHSVWVVNLFHAIEHGFHLTSFTQTTFWDQIHDQNQGFFSHLLPWSLLHITLWTVLSFFLLFWHLRLCFFTSTIIPHSGSFSLSLLFFWFFFLPTQNLSIPEELFLFLNDMVNF